MHRIKNFVHKKNTLLIRIAAVILPVLILVVMLSQTAFARNTYVITDGSRVTVHSTYATDPAVVLNEAGFRLGQNDTYTTQESMGVSEITVRRNQTIVVDNCGQIIRASSTGETVGELLSRLNVPTGEGVTVSENLETATADGMVISISRTTTVEESYTAAIPYTTTYVTDASLEPGTEQIISDGVNGEMQCVARVSYADGQEISRTIVRQNVTVEPVDQIIAVGASEPTEPETEPAEEEAYDQPTYEAPSYEEPSYEEPKADHPANAGVIPVFGAGQPIIGDGTITLATGEVLTYTNAISVMGTAYTCEGWSSPGITATGTIARVGEIAVDPDVIPLGSRLFVMSDDGYYIYGVCTAEDTGGLINGNRIDLYFDTEAECWTFGYRACTVYFLG